LRLKIDFVFLSGFQAVSAVCVHRVINGPQSAAMAAQTAAASLSGYVDFAKWGMDDNFTDSDEDDFLCTCGKVIYPHSGMLT
jgi:hypothetical protein